MKTNIYVLALAVITALASFHISSSIFWEKEKHDFGKISQNVPVETQFHFSNSGSDPIKINSVKASCGCTAVDFSKNTIKAGENGFVIARFNAANIGAFQKSVTVSLDNGEQKVLYLKGIVEAKSSN